MKRDQTLGKFVAVHLDKDSPYLYTILTFRISPEALEAPFVYDKSRDMWDLGIVFAQMLFGLDVCRRYSSPTDLFKNSS